MKAADRQGEDRSSSDRLMLEPLADRAAVRAARERPMSERLEIALSWNAVASELRAGLAAVRSSDHS